MSVTTHEQSARRALALGLAVWIGLTVLLTIVGALIADVSGVWAALLGSGIAGLFFLLTAAVAVMTSSLSSTHLNAAILGSWVVKIALLIVGLSALRGQDFYHRPMLFGTLILTTFTMLILEATLVTRAKVPYVQPE